MSEFDDLFWLVEVVEQGTLSAAAEKHGLTSAAVSKRLRLMEERLGVKLLIRNTRHLRTTEAGAMYYQRGKRLLEAFRELEDNVASTSDRLCGTIRLNAPLSFGLRQLTQPLNDYMRAHPEVKVTLHLDDRYIDIANSDYDVVIRIGHLTDSSLIAQRIGSTRIVCFASSDYLNTYGHPQTPEDLIKHQCLLYEHNSVLSDWRFYEAGQLIMPEVRGALRANNGDVLCQSALNGMGITCQPLFIAEDSLQKGLVKQVLTNYDMEELNIYAMYPSRHFLPLKIKRLIEYLKEWLHKPTF